MKKRRYWLWLGIIFAFFATIYVQPIRGFFPIPQVFEIPAGIVFHILFLSGLGEIEFVNPIGLGALLYEYLPAIRVVLNLPTVGETLVVVLFYSLFIGIYFTGGAIIGKAYEKARAHRSTTIVFFAIILVFVSFRIFTFQQKFFPTSPQDCNAWSSPFNKNSCLMNLAERKKDITICDQMPGEDVNKQDCYTALAQSTGEYYICEKITNQEYKTRCAFEVAFLKGECEKSENPDYCYLTSSEDIRIYARDDKCSRLSKRTVLQNLCEELRAGSINIHSLCEKIKDKDIFDECLNQRIDNITIDYSN